VSGLPSPHGFGKAGWAGRVRPAPGPRELESLRDAAQDLADQARPGPVFAKVTSVAILTTAALSGALAAVHLWKALFPRHQEHGREPSQHHRTGTR
jgi:hypothetical protein